MVEKRGVRRRSEIDKVEVVQARVGVLARLVESKGLLERRTTVYDELSVL